MMRINTVIAILFLLASNAKAQQIPITSQPLTNAYYYNPAAAGVQKYIDVTLGGRQQWLGIENAPQSYYAYVNSALGKSNGKDFSYLSLPVSNPGYYKTLQNSTPKVQHAIGGRLFADSYGAFSEIGAGADYAIHLPLKEKVYLSFGVGFELSNFYFDKAKAEVLDEYDPTYDQFLSGQESEFLFNGRVGAYLYTDKLRLGYALNQLVQNKLNSQDDPNSYQGQRIHHFGNASYRFALNKVGITPSLSVLFANQSPINLYGGLLFDYNRLLLISAAYRNEGSLILGLGFTFSKIVRLSYTYDLPISGELQRYNYGSHELVVKLMLNRKKGSNE